MKHTFRYLLIPALMTMCGCTEDLVQQGGVQTEPGLPITFNAAYPTASRATDAGFEDGDRMGLFVLDYVDGEPQAIDGEPHASNVRFEFDETDHKCKGVTDLYWTDANTPADLVAYYPFQTEISDVRAMDVVVERRQDTSGTEQNMGGYETSDLLYAKVTKAMPTAGAIDMTFNHALAGIRVTLVKGSGFAADEWSSIDKSVIVTNTVTDGKIDLSDGSVTTGSTAPASIIPLVYGEDFRAVTVPQTVAAGTRLFAITVDGQGYDFARDADMVFRQGKMHSFTITVSKKADGKYAFQPTSEGITPWLDSVDFRDGLMKQYVVVDVPEVGGLGEAVKSRNLEPSRIYNLKLRGNLNEKDFEYIREEIRNLKALNIYETKVECFVDSGGGHSGIEKDYLPGAGLRDVPTLTHLVFPKYVKTIGEQFLAGSNIIGDLIIPEGVEYLEWGCFMSCNALLNVTFPQTLKVIGGSAFEYSSLSGELMLPDNLEAIGGGAFNECHFTGELNLPSKLKIINEVAFKGCEFSGSLVFPQGIKKVAPNCFFSAGFTGTLVLPEGVEEIGDEAFAYCGFRGELKLPSTLKRISARSFLGTMISGIIFPDDLGDMGDAAFGGCSRLQGTLTIPEKLTVIPADAFLDCTLLDEIILPKNIAKITGGAFANCYNLSSIICHAEVPPTMKSEDSQHHVFDGVPRDNFTVQVPAASVEAYKNAKEWKEFKRIAAYSNFVCRPASACALNTVHTEDDVILNADGAWEVTHKPDWVTLSKTSGTGKARLTLTFSKLARGAGDREDYIEFRLTGKDDITTRCELVQKDYEHDENSCITLQKATKGRGIDVVFVGDSFDAEAIASGAYLEQVKDQMEAFFGVEPFTTYRDYFNVKACFSLSQEVGVNTANTWRNTKFKTHYAPPSLCTSGLLECFEPDAVFDYVATYAGIKQEDMWRTLVVMTLNSDEYGSNSVISGSGASIAIVGRSSDPYPMDSRGLMQREACGVAFGKLASERATSVSYLSKNERNLLTENNGKGWYMNLSLNGNLHEVWWSDFIFDPAYSDKVDVYEGGLGRTRGCFRSEINSCMNFGIPYFSLASRYDIVRRIMQYAGVTFTKDEFLAHDSDAWGRTGSRAPGDCTRATVSYSNQTKFYKSKKY